MPLTKSSLLNQSYTVPNSKILVILNITTASTNSPGTFPKVFINGKEILNGTFNNYSTNSSHSGYSYDSQTNIGGVLNMPIFLNQGDTISSNRDDTVINGYLK